MQPQTTREEALQELFQIASQKAQNGEKAEARLLFQRICVLDRGNENAWVWRAYLAENLEEGITSLQQVLRINPNNSQALAWLKRISPAAIRLKKHVCPFCSGERHSDGQSCTQCNAVISLENFDRFAHIENIKEDAVRSALLRIQGEGAPGGFEGYCITALAHMNLFESNAALTCLESAARLKPFDTAVSAALRKLQQRPVVLAVDDSHTVRTLVCRTLERSGHRTIQAASGAEALNILSTNPIDLILLDVSMPVMDGHQFCKKIKEHSDTKNIPVVMLSGNDGFFDKVRGRLSGAVDYLTKPVQPGTLIQVIAKQLARKKGVAGHTGDRKLAGAVVGLALLLPLWQASLGARELPLGELFAVLEDTRTESADTLEWSTHWKLCWAKRDGAERYEVKAITAEGSSARVRSIRENCFRVEVAAGRNPVSKGLLNRDLLLALQRDRSPTRSAP